MFLTRIYLNPHRRGARRLLRSRQILHAAVLNCFPPGAVDASEAPRVLWRLDRPADVRRASREGSPQVGSPSYALFVSSPVPPDPSHIVEEAGYATDGGVVVRELDGFLDRLEAGQRWGFRLCVNPTFREAGQVNGRGQKKVLAHVTQDQQTQWVLDRAGRCGFRVVSSAEYGGDLPVLEDSVGQRVDGANLLINGVERSTAEFRRGGERVTLALATFEGVLEVTEPEALRRHLVHGIGRGKAYGCGLMTLARP